MKTELEMLFVEVLNEVQKEFVWKMICLCDNEFVPALSSRSDTSKLITKPIDNAENLPIDFFSDMLANEQFILVFDKSTDKFIGFMSINIDFDNIVLPEYSPSIYISVICVHPDFRNNGIAKQLYKYLFSKFGLGNAYTVRTWTQNYNHCDLLRKIGFKIVKTFKDERGKGIDTLYFACKEMMF